MGARRTRGTSSQACEAFVWTTVFTYSLLTFEQLMRLNELVRTQTGSAADKKPLQFSDIKYFGSDGTQLVYDNEGRPRLVVVVMGGMIMVQMHPSKTDPAGSRNESLRAEPWFRLKCGEAGAVEAHATVPSGSG